MARQLRWRSTAWTSWAELVRNQKRLPDGSRRGHTFWAVHAARAGLISSSAIGSTIVCK